VTDDDEYGVDDDALDEADEARARAGAPEDVAEGRARGLLDEMLTLAREHRGAVDAKAAALLRWVHEHQCRAVGSASRASKADRAWTNRRVLIFTEYGDTKRYLKNLLSAAIEGTDD